MPTEFTRVNGTSIKTLTFYHSLARVDVILKNKQTILDSTGRKKQKTKNVKMYEKKIMAKNIFKTMTIMVRFHIIV